jgi:hypothetical protein
VFATPKCQASRPKEGIYSYTFTQYKYWRPMSVAAAGVASQLQGDYRVAQQQQEREENEAPTQRTRSSIGLSPISTVSSTRSQALSDREIEI